MKPPRPLASLSLAALLALAGCTTAPELRDGRALTFNVEGRGLVKMEAINVHAFRLQGEMPICLWDLKVHGFKKTEIYPGSLGTRNRPVCASKRDRNKPNGPYVAGAVGIPFPVYVVNDLYIEFRRSADGPLERYSTTVPFTEYSAKGDHLDSPQFVIDETSVSANVAHFAKNGAFVARMALPVTLVQKGAE